MRFSLYTSSWRLTCLLSLAPWVNHTQRLYSTLVEFMFRTIIQLSNRFLAEHSRPVVQTSRVYPLFVGIITKKSTNARPVDNCVSVNFNFIECLLRGSRHFLQVRYRQSGKFASFHVHREKMGPFKSGRKKCFHRIYKKLVFFFVEKSVEMKRSSLYKVNRVKVILLTEIVLFDIKIICFNQPTMAGVKSLSFLYISFTSF